MVSQSGGKVLRVPLAAALYVLNYCVIIVSFHQCQQTASQRQLPGFDICALWPEVTLFFFHVQKTFHYHVAWFVILVLRLKGTLAQTYPLQVLAQEH